MDNKDINNKGQNPEVPQISVERDNDELSFTGTSSLAHIEDDDKVEIVASESGKISNENRARNIRSVMKWSVACCVIVLCVILGLTVYTLLRDKNNVESVSHIENIYELGKEINSVRPEVIKTSDSILGVALDFYQLRGLRADIEFEEPDTADRKVFLYARSADYCPDSTVIGSLVASGKEIASDNSRAGYMAMANGNMVIGISDNEDVKDYVKSKDGSFFRQFPLLIDGVVASGFQLHGKVERRAMASLSGKLYYIASKYKETMWDFADALREYGFTDAIYITGGNDYNFYRDSVGTRHDIGTKPYPHTKYKGIIPWVVFRANE